VHVCFQHHVTLLSLKFDLRWPPLFGHDAHIYAYQWHLVYLYALNLTFVLYYHHVYERDRLTKNMIPSRVFNHKKFYNYFCTVLLSVFLIQKLPKALFSLFTLVLLILQAVGACQPPQLVGDAKLFVHYCRLFEWRGTGTNLRLSWEFDNYPKSPLWGKLLLLRHSTLGVPTSSILKNRVAAISTRRQELYSLICH
jgi:hypothetical protein